MRGKLTSDQVYMSIEKYEILAKDKMKGVPNKHLIYMQGKKAHDEITTN
jgi:hypothetical protein